MQPVAAIGIDLDTIDCYRAIHGLAPGAGEQDPVYALALPRFLSILQDLQLPATLFVIGRDAAPNAAALAEAHAQGCELASHTFTHDYRISRAAPARIDEELSKTEEALATISGARPVGFRAPGYNVTPTLLSRLQARGYLYDSSLLPSPMYFFARAAAIGLYRLRGRRSASLVGQARAWAGPLHAYRATATRPWRPAASGLVELPMSALPGLRLPLIGTSWVALPKAARSAALALSLPRLPLFNFELHGVDLLDADDPGVGAELSAAQPDLRLPWRRKAAALRELFETLKTDRPVATLAALAVQL